MLITDGDVDRFWPKVSKTDGCWLWTAGVNKASGGHGSFWLSGEQKDAKAHRVAWQLANGPIPEGLCVCHSCDVPHCVNPSHLWLGTQADNVRDMAEKGRSGRDPTWRGERTNLAKLTEREVLAVKQLRASGLKLREIGARFGIADATVSVICSGKRWRHLSQAEAKVG